MPWSPLGQPVTVSTTVTTPAGVPADAGAITAALYGPDGALAQTYGSPAHDGVGLYHQDIPAADLNTAGHYRYVWTSTGANAGVRSEVLDVFDPAAYPRLVSLADAREYVGLRGTADDWLLDRMVGWASARILREVVAYSSVYTQTVTARHGRLILSRVPVRAVTAAAGLSTGATPLTAGGLVVTNALQGIVAGDTATPSGVYEVTYTAGYDEVPPGVDGACLTLVQHWWTQSQAHGSATYGDGGFVPDFEGLPHAVRNKLAVVPNPVLMA